MFMVVVFVNFHPIAEDKTFCFKNYNQLQLELTTLLTSELGIKSLCLPLL